MTDKNTDNESRFSGDYAKMTAVEVDGRDIQVSFANGDCVKLETCQLEPLGFFLFDWAKARVRCDGIYFSVPASPRDAEISWDVVRALTDEAYSARAAELAGRQARMIGIRLKTLRARRGLTQRQVAESVGIEESNLSRIENGSHNLRISTVWKILAAVGCGPEDLERATDQKATP